MLKEERAKAMGDPIRGITTPFIESLDTGLPPPNEPTVEILSKRKPSEDSSQPPPRSASSPKNEPLNHYLTKSELEEALKYSRDLSEPLKEKDDARRDTVAEARAAEEHESKHRTAQEAVSRIVSLGNTSSKERTRANVRRIIDNFGRHNTETYLRPKAPSSAMIAQAEKLKREEIDRQLEGNIQWFERDLETRIEEVEMSILELAKTIKDLTMSTPTERLEASEQEIILSVQESEANSREIEESTKDPLLKQKLRAGPDTGSSEVQIGILTAKIRILADRYAGENRNDKVNKRNLRLLLHRRQKLLKYMEKKERGSDRWHNMIEKLGLTEATWRGEIEVQ